MNSCTLLAFHLVLLTSVGTLAQARQNFSVGRGKIVYEQNCLPCHSADGSSVARISPTLINAGSVIGEKSALIGILLKGMKDIEIGGEKYDEPMPSFSALSDDDLAAVLTYIRNNFGNTAEVVTGEDVMIVRKGG